MSMFVLLIIGAIQITLVLALVLLGILARRQRERADPHSEQDWGVPITDEVEVVAAYAEEAVAAAERALEEADQAHDRAVRAAATRDMAERRYRFARKHAEAAGEPYRLVQRAALDAYQRRQLSVTELNRIWQHTQVMVEPAPRPAAVPLGWELRVHEAQLRYEQAAADAARAQEDARLRAATAAALAEEAEAARSHLSAAMHSANTGLVGLLRANWAA
ncbi:hypothetical protein [Actinoplanes subtropicus]|uniref:hypothetical protein n=1 Tax=Actinoplanes subtropicus TaxID=543632 RepID=UPI000A7AEF58|nr:hypothetical protein [Actinoplanes subtropicus]